MAHAASPMPSQAHPPVAMLSLITGYWVSQIIHTAAKLDLADKMRNAPRTAESLAQETGTDAGTLSRLLRALAGLGVFREEEGKRFSLTPVGATLCSDHPWSMRAFARMMMERYNVAAWQELGWCLETGGTGIEKVFGMGCFDYLAEHPEDARAFSEAMTSVSTIENPAVAMGYDFSRFKTIVDVGGGHGSLLSLILGRAPALRGILYDLPAVIREAGSEAHVKKEGIASRLELRSGDFFEDVPDGGDAYLLKYILHDWPDERAAAILKNIRRRIAPEGRLVVVDTVVPEGNEPHWGKLLDINMLVLTGGRERTEAELRALFETGGFVLSRVISTMSHLSIIEGVPGS